MSFIEPTISRDHYDILKTFMPREGYDNHSVKIKFKDMQVKKKVMKDSQKKIKWEKCFWKMTLTRKENKRLYNKMKQLIKDNTEAGVDLSYKIEKGKLYWNDDVIDEFNVSNSLFQ